MCTLYIPDICIGTWHNDMKYCKVLMYSNMLTLTYIVVSLMYSGCIMFTLNDDVSILIDYYLFSYQSLYYMIFPYTIIIKISYRYIKIKRKKIPFPRISCLLFSLSHIKNISQPNFFVCLSNMQSLFSSKIIFRCCLD